MVAGTSTGGILAGLIATGKTAVEIEALYLKLVKQVFTKRNVFATRFIDPPEYTKKHYREILRDQLDNMTIKDACIKTNTDIMITSKDVVAGEETYFTCFKDESDYIGTYKDTLLRSVMEATMSAPTYFTPLERFVDGGVTSYNNPVLAAIMEAVHYGPKDNTYAIDKMTVFSFGTGCSSLFVLPDQVTHPDGPDAYFWLKWLMTESGEDASDMQNFVIRSGAFNGLEFRRFQISLDKTAMGKLPERDLSGLDDVKADWLSDLSDADLADIPLDKVSLFPLMKVIGEAMVEYIVNTQGIPFTADLVGPNGKDLLVSRLGDIARIQAQMSKPSWLDEFET